MPESTRKSPGRSLALGAAAVALVAGHAWMALRFLPNANGRLGHDYSYFLLHLLDGYFWSHRNGVFDVPWGTPGFCGGLPKFPNPQALYFSVPQLLTRFVDPLNSVRATFVIFAALGFSGFFALLRRVFDARDESALLGATLFLFNGLYVSRMLIGHLTFHGFMLVPWLALLLVPAPGVGRGTAIAGLERRALPVACAAIVLAYLAVTSLPHVLFQAIAIVLMIAALAALIREETFCWRSFTVNLACAGVLAIGLAAAKLAASVAYLQHFPRSLYPLPGFDSVVQLIAILLLSLFSTPPIERVGDAVVNARWSVGPQEFEFGLTPVPFILIFVTIFVRFSPRMVWDRLRSMSSRERASLALLVLLLAAPIALNFHQAAWHDLLKRTPVLSSSSSLFRWFSVYIPFVCVVASLCLDREPLFARHRETIAIVGIAIVVGMNIARERTFYAAQSFDPGPVVDAYERVRSGTWSPRIERIAVARDAAGDEALVKHRNASLVRGESQLLCYETLFGFRLERFPRGTLHEGDVMDVREGRLNLKNPACHVFPEENGCAPGDHFTLGQRAAAERFVSYRPYEFEISNGQRVANVVSLATTAIVTLISFGCAGRMLARRSGGDADAEPPS